MPISDLTFKKALDDGTWTARRDGALIASDALKIGLNSCDVSLDRRLKRITVARGYEAIDPYEPDSQHIEEIEIGPNGYVLCPGEFVLGAVRESFDCSAPLWIEEFLQHNGEYRATSAAVRRHFFPEYDGRSTTARISITSHQSSGRGDFGFGSNGACFTLEISAILPVVLRAEMRIGQVFFVPILGEISGRYESVYAHQNDGPKAAVLGFDRFN